MFKTQLSSNLIPEKGIMVVVPAITFFSWAALQIYFAIFGILLLLILVPYSIYSIYMSPLNIAYDASFLFVTNRKTEKIISLKSITGVHPASGYLSLRVRWQISYSEHGLEDTLYFYPTDKNDVSQFIKVARMQNPMIGILN